MKNRFDVARANSDYLTSIILWIWTCTILVFSSYVFNQQVDFHLACPYQIEH